MCDDRSDEKLIPYGALWGFSHYLYNWFLFLLHGHNDCGNQSNSTSNESTVNNLTEFIQAKTKFPLVEKINSLTWRETDI